MERPPEPEQQSDPEAQLAALHHFLDATTAAMSIQLEQLQLMQLHPTLFPEERVAHHAAVFRQTTEANSMALRDFFAENSPSLQVVHERLGEPAQLVHFFGFDPVFRTYNVGIITHQNIRQIWPIVAAREIQLATE